ncbi:single-stranded DNA-binding protein [Luteipulveratus halotolerans]|uniref:Single-stranded DNA-binding protein n=1 Tax=Luteipulveratus halotolerans TaxID=1631356 RepID=A0A0L6CQ58_9MICO|nr:single-stranded DNA-binding protein [Luteipulveratus halotolerans]KNX39673.1 hypothetical protein VV01_00090 [Luteipulveratus halotolerans]KNX39716.1 hypothetical protein VV01_00345 [Luteipulveratus halotolerans]
MSTRVETTANLIKMPELEQSKTGKPYARVRALHTVRARNTSTGEWGDLETIAYDLVVFGQDAEGLCRTAPSGRKNLRVRFAGRLEVEVWQREDGTTGRSNKVVTDYIAPMWTQDLQLSTRGGAPAPTAPTPVDEDGWPIHGQA